MAKSNSSRCVILTAITICVAMLSCGCTHQSTSANSQTNLHATAPPSSDKLPTVTITEEYSYFEQSPLFEQAPFKITFAYPANWEFDLRGSLENGGLYLALGNPAKPTPTVIAHDANLNRGVILVFLELVDPTTFSLDEEVDTVIKLRRIDRDFSLIENKILTIAGYPARWTVHEVAPRFHEGHKYYEDVFLLVHEQYYRFMLDILVSERDGAFGKGFDLMIRSIQIVGDE